MRFTRSLAFVLLAQGLWLGCGGGDGLFGTVEDRASVQTGDLRTVTLRKGTATTTLIFPANVLPAGKTIDVALVSGVVRKGRFPVTATAVQFAPAPLTFDHPVKMRQAVPAAGPRKRYAAVQVVDNGGSFVQRTPGRRVAETAEGDEVWEIDVTDSGLWGIAEEEGGTPGTSGGRNGVVEDEVVMRLGSTPQTVILGNGPRRTQIEAPAQPPGVEVDVNLQLLSGVVRAGTPPANGGAIRVGPGMLVVPNPMKAQQSLPPPPPMRTYAVAVTTDDGAAWTVVGPAKQPTPAATPDGGVMAALAAGNQTWQMDLPRAGIYALVLVPAPGATIDGGAEPDGGTPDGGVEVDAAPVERPAQLAATPAALGFGSVVAGETSASVALNLRNEGTLATGTVAATLAGADAAMFSVVTNDCPPAGLAGGATCQLTLLFKPTAPGARSATLSVQGVPGGTLSVNLAGTGQAPGEIRVTPSAHAFASTLIAQTSAAATITVTNPGDKATGQPAVSLTGADAARFSITSDGCSAGPLAPAATCQIQVVFQPTAAGQRVANLVVRATPGGEAQVALSALGANPARLAVAPPSLDFGAMEVGRASGPRTLTVTNTGDVPTGPLGTSQSGPGSGSFTVMSDDCMGRALAATASCAITVRFGPDAAGARAASLAVTGDPGGSVAVPLSGTGMAPAALTIEAPNGNAGNVVIGAGGALAFVVRNTGGVPSGVPTIAITGPNAGEFVVTSNGCTAAVAGGDSCNLGVTFTPTAAGARTASLAVSASPGGGPTVALSGTGITPGALAISPGNNAFADAAVGSASAPVSFTITNQGGSAAGVPTVALSGAAPSSFEIVSNTCTVMLAPSDACSVGVRFRAPVAGLQAAALTVSATPGGTVNAALTGRGLAAARLTIMPAAADFGSSAVGVQASTGPVGAAPVPLVRAFTVTNAGDVASGPLVLTMGGANPGDFAIGADACSRIPIEPGDTCTFGTTFTPVGFGKRSAVINVAASPGGGADVTLDGTGTGADLEWEYATSPDGRTVYYDFGAVTANDSAPMVTLDVVNRGDATSGQPALTWDNPTDFAVSTVCSARMPNGVAPGQACTSTIRPTLQVPGARVTRVQVAATPGGTTTLEFRVLVR